MLLPPTVRLPWKAMVMGVGQLPIKRFTPSMYLVMPRSSHWAGTAGSGAGASGREATAGAMRTASSPAGRAAGSGSTTSGAGITGGTGSISSQAGQRSRR